MAVDLQSISAGVDYLKDGYIEYAEEVIKARALPSLYDGLKPVNRHILVALNDFKSKNYIKSARVVGDTMGNYHPHGDSAIYEALVLMTDKNGSLAFPSISGSGSFGGVYKTDPPAAMRYTESKIREEAKEEYFGEMNGIEMIPNFDMTLMEPELLPVSFPAVLVNSTSGIAVGFRCNIPSFNFNDVCDLVIEYIQDGSCHTVIEPDFVTGGYYVRNEKELQKLMRIGSGKIKLRGKHIINGKEINVTEVPYGKTIQGLLQQINKSDISAIRNAYDTDDFDHNCMFTVDCVNKNRVTEALYGLYKSTDFQYTYSADITVIDNGIPRKMGVWQIIESWVAWRKEVLLKEYNHRLDGLLEAKRESEAFMALMRDESKRDEFTTIVIQQGRDAGRKYLRENFTRDEIPEDLIKFVGSRSLPDYHDGGKYLTEYEGYKLQIDSLKKSIDDIDSVIVAQMQALKNKYGTRLARRTEITDVDYNFTSTEDSKEKFVDTSTCYYEFNGGFLKKLRLPTGDKVEYSFEGTASDVLIALDNRGRVLRVYCEEIPMSGAYETGIYLPRYFNLNESDDYKITYIGVLDGSELMLLYKDGYVGYVDTNEWLGNGRRIKVIEKGIHPDSAQYLGVVLKSWDEMLFVTDTTGRVAWCYTADIKHKHRTARTRVFNLYRDNLIDSYSLLPVSSGSMFLANLENYQGKLTKLKAITDFRGSEDDFILID